VSINKIAKKKIEDGCNDRHLAFKNAKKSVKKHLVPYFIQLPKGSEKQVRALIKCARKMGKQQSLKRKAELKSLSKKQSIQ
jgi:hypothetical protein